MRNESCPKFQTLKKERDLLSIKGQHGELYEFVKLIGQGGCGTVIKAKKVGKSGQFFAIKSFPSIQDKDDFEYQAFQYTAHIENVVKAKSLIKTEHDTHIVMEMLEGGDFWDYLFENGPMSRYEALALFTKLVKTVGELLQIGLYPGDIKAENLFYDKKKKVLKILDLGGLKHIKKRNEYKMNMVTMCFSPPEYHLETNQSKKESINTSELHLSWTLGLLLWHMLSGEQKTIYNMKDIKHFELKIPPNAKSLQGSETFHLVQQLLALNPEKRMKFWLLHKKLGKN